MQNRKLIPVAGVRPEKKPERSKAMFRTVEQLAGMSLEPWVFDMSEIYTVFEDRKFRRSWSVRLFTRPWRPWRAFDVVETAVPDPELMVYELSGVIAGHPATIRRLLLMQGDLNP